VSLRSVPDEFKESFESPRSADKEKLNALKERIRKSGAEVFENYPATFGGLVEDKPIMVGLEAFSQNVANAVWNALLTICDENREVRINLYIRCRPPSNKVYRIAGRRMTLFDGVIR
jgi:hypothetical protein